VTEINEIPFWFKLKRHQASYPVKGGQFLPATQRHIEKFKADVSKNPCPDLVADCRSKIRTARRQVESDFATECQCLAWATHPQISNLFQLCTQGIAVAILFSLCISNFVSKAITAKMQ
jgi:hypothetical protein